MSIRTNLGSGQKLITFLTTIIKKYTRLTKRLRLGFYYKLFIECLLLKKRLVRDYQKKINRVDNLELTDYIQHMMVRFSEISYDVDQNNIKLIRNRGGLKKALDIF